MVFTRIQDWRFWLISAALAVLAPFVLHPLLAMQILCFALFAAAFNLLGGYLGLISFGHAAFFGVGAYLSAYATRDLHWTTETGILGATAATALLGVIVGFLAIRRKGIYFAMITLALAQLVFFVCHQAPFTGAEDGMPGVPRGHLFGVVSLDEDLVMYSFIFLVVGACLALIYRIIHSPFGTLMQGIRDNEQRAVSLGYDVDRAKLLAFVLSATLTGLAGALKAIAFEFASETDVLWTTSGVPLLAALIGGIGTLPGPVIGVTIIVLMEHFLAGLNQWVFFVQGAIFVVVVSFFRKGIYGEFLALRKRKLSQRPADPAATSPTSNL